MRMLDLFCGRFGWGKVFAARGHEVVGIDLVQPEEIPEGCTFFKSDILKIAADSPFMHWDDGTDYFDFICASSPCEQFSVHGMKHFHPNPPYPEMGIKLFNHTRAICEASGVPYIMENVRAAQQFVGNAVNHCGPFYLWGNAVPPMMPQGISKGMKLGNTALILAMSAEEKKSYRKQFPHVQSSSHSKARAASTANIATIPTELASTVCDYAERLLEQRKTA
jgi:C-5 cytosine-specific DNA methylase